MSDEKPTAWQAAAFPQRLQQAEQAVRDMASLMQSISTRLRVVEDTLKAHQINPPDARFPHAGNAETPGEYGASE